MLAKKQENIEEKRKQKKKEKETLASVTSATVGRDIHQSFGVCEVNLATMNVTIKTKSNVTRITGM